MTGSVVKGQVQREDLAAFDGKTLTASRADSSGGTTTGTRLNNTVDVKTLFGGTANRAALQKALDSLGSTNVALEFTPETWSIDDDVTVGSNFTMVVPAGCVFDISAGKTLTNNGVLFRQHATYTSGSGTFTQSGSDLLATVAGTQTNIYAIDSGTTDAYAITTAASISSYTDGDTFRFQASSANTGACTLAVDGQSAIAIRKFGTRTALSANDILNDGIYTVVYDAANAVFQLQQQPVSSFVEGMLNDADADAVTTTLGLNINSQTAVTSLADADELTMYNDAAGAVRKITVANARSTIANLEVIDSGTSTASTLEFASLSSTYRYYELVFDDLLGTVDSAALRGQFSVAASWQEGASDYADARIGVLETGTDVGNGNAAASVITIASGCGHTDAFDEIAGTIRIYGIGSATGRAGITWQVGGQNTTPNYRYWGGAGQLQATSAPDGFRLLWSSGSFASISYTLYGVRAS